MSGGIREQVAGYGRNGLGTRTGLDCMFYNYSRKQGKKVKGKRSMILTNYHQKHLEQGHKVHLGQDEVECRKSWGLLSVERMFVLCLPL